MSSDQKFTTITSTGSIKTISGGSTNLGPCRITYIQCEGVAASKLILRDATTGTGAKVFEVDFGTEGLQMRIPGNGIRFETAVHATITATTSVTIGYTG